MNFIALAQRSRETASGRTPLKLIVSTLLIALLSAFVMLAAFNASSARAEKIGKVNVNSCASAIKALNYTVKRVATRKAELKYLRTSNAKRNARAKRQLKKARKSAAAARAAVRKYCVGAQGVNAQSGPCFVSIETFTRSVNLAATTRIKTKRVKQGKRLTKKQANRRRKTIKRLDDTVKRNLQLVQTSCASPGNGSGDVGAKGDGGGGDNGDGGGAPADTTAPVITVSVAAVTNDTTPHVNLGSNEVGTTFECKIDGGAFAPVASEFDIAPALSEGVHTLTCRGTDAAGNVSDEVVKSITVDTSAPDLSVSGPDGATNDTTPTYVPTSTDPDATITCSVDGGPATTVASGDSYTPGPLGEGAHTISCTADDGNGNTSTVEKEIVVDTTAPTSPSIGGPDTTNDTTPSFPVTSDPNGTTVCSVDGGQQQQTVPNGASYNPTLGEGTHTITCVTTDGAGNTTTTTKTVTIDTTGPNTSVTGPSSTNDNTPTFTVTPNEAGATVECKTDSGAYAPVAGGSYTTTALADGAHSVTCRSTDAVGNVGAPATKSFTVDTVAPTLTMTGPSGLQPDSTPTYTLTPSEAGATLQCAIDGGAYVNVTSPYTTPDLVQGTHTITCRAVDAAGNVGPTKSKITTIGTDYDDPVTKHGNGSWGLACTPLDFLLPLGCPSGVVSHTIPAHPDGLTGNYQVNLSGAINRICSLGGIFPSYTMSIVVDGQAVASDTDGGLIDMLCLFPISLSAQKLNLTLSSATAHTISLHLRSNLQLSVFPHYDCASLTVDIAQL